MELPGHDQSAAEWALFSIVGQRKTNLNLFGSTSWFLSSFVKHQKAAATAHPLWYDQTFLNSLTFSLGHNKMPITDKLGLRIKQSQCVCTLMRHATTPALQVVSSVHDKLQRDLMLGKIPLNLQMVIFTGSGFFRAMTAKSELINESPPQMTN